jgi:hypothetical protein
MKRMKRMKENSTPCCDVFGVADGAMERFDGSSGFRVQLRV